MRLKVIGAGSIGNHMAHAARSLDRMSSSPTSMTLRYAKLSSPTLRPAFQSPGTPELRRLETACLGVAQDLRPGFARLAVPRHECEELLAASNVSVLPVSVGW